MANEKYWTLRTEPGDAALGPNMGGSTNDAWVIIARYPTSSLPVSATQRLAIFVKGTMGEVSYQGPNLPQQGLVQVCLGLTSGLKSNEHRQSLPIRESANDVNTAFNGIQFSFLMVQQAGNGGTRPAISDATFGPFLDTTSLPSEICLWGRVAWNGDSAYTAEAVVADVQWLVFDMDAMEANDHVRAIEGAPPAQLSTSYQEMALDPNDLGSEDDDWLHFGQVVYRPKSPTLTAPKFEFGQSDDGLWGPGSGFIKSVEVGQLRGGNYNGGSEVPQQSQGCFWHKTRPAAGYRTVITGRDLHAVGGLLSTDVLRAITLSIKLDEMEDSNFYAGASFLADEAATFASPSPEEAYVPLERPTYNYVTRTALFFGGQWGNASGGGQPLLRESAKLRIHDVEQNHLHTPRGFCWLDGTRGEQVQLMEFVTLSLPPSNALQWQGHIIVRTNNAAPRSVYSPHQCSAYSLFDPSNVPTAPWVEPAPVTLQIGREAALPLPELTVAPNSATPVTMEGYKFGEIVGKTGYKRTWPTWFATRRTFLLSWEPLATATAQTLEAWLIANPAFKFTPQGEGVEINCVVSGKLEIERIGDGRSTLRVNAVELIWVI